MPTAQFKKSHCGCTTKNSTLVKPGRCPKCGPSQTLRKSLHGAHALCGCTTSRGNPQRLDRCKTRNQAGSSVSLVHKTSVNTRTADTAETVYSALPEVFCLALSLSRSLLLLSSLSRSFLLSLLSLLRALPRLAFFLCLGQTVNAQKI